MTAARSKFIKLSKLLLDMMESTHISDRIRLTAALRLDAALAREEERLDRLRTKRLRAARRKAKAEAAAAVARRNEQECQHRLYAAIARLASRMEDAKG